MDDEFKEMACGDKATFDVFKWTKKVVHESGFRVWVGEEAVEPEVRS